MPRNRSVAFFDRLVFVCSLVFLAGVGTVAHANPIKLHPIGTYQTGLVGKGATEIVTYHAATKRLFSINVADREVDIISMADPSRLQKIGSVSLAKFGSDPTSVACRRDLVAASVIGSQPTDRGTVVFFRPTGELIGSIPVGFHPDMIMFSPDGTMLVVANEGEPSVDGLVDQEGSVSVITMPANIKSTLDNVTVRHADFRRWNGRPLPPGVRLVQPGKSAAQDFEPEGIAVSGDSKTAYVSLQENNAIAVVDLESAKVERLFGLGFKDHSTVGNEIDTEGLGHARSLRTCPVKGMYQPDNVTWFQSGGAEYLLLANEGDARDNDAFHEEIQLKDAVLDPERFPNAAELLASEQLRNLIVSQSGDTDGDGDLDELLMFGARSISIVTVAGESVFDSGCMIEKAVCDRIGKHAGEPEETAPRYRTKKGPEPEGLVMVSLDGRTYAFVCLERDNGIMAFDVTDARHPAVADYLNPFEVRKEPIDVTSDAGPESMVFISASDSATGKPLLAVANEYSGSITIYELTPLTSRTASINR